MVNLSDVVLFLLDPIQLPLFWLAYTFFWA